MKTGIIPIGMAVALGLGLAGCSSDSQQPAATDGATVVATTTIWGSITSQIVSCAGTGESVTLMPVGADAHDFAPSATDVATMVGADLVVANGLGLEQGMESALESAAADGANVLEVAPHLDPIPFGDAGSGDDPHVFHDMSRVATAAKLIGEELATATGDDSYATCGQQVSDDILAAQTDVEGILAAIPAQDRILVTDHDALGYFAEAYDFTIAGVVIPGGSTLAEPSSAELAELTQTITEAGVPAIFSNTANSTDIIDAVAAEVGDIEVVALYVESLGEPGTQAETYQGMMTSNATAIAGALA